MDKVKAFQEKNQRLQALLAKGESLSAEELQEAEQLAAECEALKGEIEAAQALRARAQSLASWETTPAAVVPHAVGVGAAPAGSAAGAALASGVGAPAPKLPAMPAQAFSGRVRSFKERGGMRAEERAYRYGRWFMGAVMGDRKSLQYCREHGIQLAYVVQNSTQVREFAHSEEVNANGGYLVPPEFESDLIDLRERFGVFRRLAKNSVMASDTKSVPRRTGGLTAYFTGESDTITDSTKGWDNVTLTARKLAVLAYYSSELDEDAVINIGDDLASEISYAFSQKEDDCGFNGDATPTYGGITGVRSKLKGLSGTIANIAGLVVAAGNAYSEIVLSDFNKVKAKLPQYVTERGRPAWIASKGFYHEVMEKLALAAGGVTAAEIAAGRNQPFFMGYPVEIAQVMPSVEDNSQVCCLFGDLSLAALFGDRRMSTVAVSEHLKFAEDQLAIRGTERFDINVHDVGNASATASARVPGPVVGLITAAS